jgi:amino acid transporter
MARQGLLPAAFARLEGEKRVPRTAVLFVVVTCATVGLLSLAILRNGLDSFVWWSNAMVFFAALTFTGVNLANFFYFQRILPQQFGVMRNLLVPAAGVAVNLYLIYAAFFSALWSAPFRMGRSIVVACLVLFALELLAATWLRLFRRDRLVAPIGAEPDVMVGATGIEPVTPPV